MLGLIFFDAVKLIGASAKSVICALDSPTSKISTNKNITALFKLKKIRDFLQFFIFLQMDFKIKNAR
jgi:hypothetical protein